MSPRLLELLGDLYERSLASATAVKIEALVERWRPRLPPASGQRDALPLTQRDALLITYADQVRTPGLAPLRSLTDFASRQLRGLVSGIHLLPFYPWSSDDGFSVKDYFAVDPDYGTWDDLAQLGANFHLMFDAVFNHVSARSEWFLRFLAGDSRFARFFISVEGDPDLSAVVRPRTLPLLTEFPTSLGPRRIWTTFSADQVDLNYGNPEVLLAVLEALLFYVSKGARFFRLDAVAFLWKTPGTSCLHLPQTHRLVQLWRALLDEVAPQVLLVTETNVPHAENLSYFGDGANEAQLVYNFALPPLVLHSFRAGSAQALTRWAQSLRLPSRSVTFFNFLASHDGIGLNPVRGLLSERDLQDLVAGALDHGGLISYKQAAGASPVPYELNINYLDALSGPAARESVAQAAERFLTAEALMLSLQGVPGLYFHSLVGSRGDPAGAQASGLPRRINRQKLDLGSLEAELAEGSSLRARVFAGHRRLLELRRAHPAFAPAAPQRVLELDPRLFAVLRETEDGADRMLCVHNLSRELVDLRGPEVPKSTPPLGPLQFVWLRVP